MSGQAGSSKVCNNSAIEIIVSQQLGADIKFHVELLIHQSVFAPFRQLFAGI